MSYKTISGYGTGNDKWAFISSPLVGSTEPDATAIENLFSASEYDLYRFNQANVTGQWENYKAHTDGFMIENGKGYLYASQQDVNLIFKGTFNEASSQDVPLACSGNGPLKGYNLVGNPFPCNAYANRPYYVMNADGNTILATPVSTSEPIAPCTGIVVQAFDTEQNPTVTFSTTAPSTSNQGNLNIVLSQQVNRSNTVIDNAVVSFDEGVRLGKFYFMQQDANIYFPLGNEDYAIAFSDKQGEMPLNFKANRQGEYTITVNPEDVEMEYLHLIDNMNGADVDLVALAKAQQPASYTFTASTMDYPSRFRLVFNKDGQDSPSANSESFAYCNGNEWNVSNSGQAVLQVVDALGHVLSSTCIDGDATLGADHLANGVYVLRLISNESVRTQKVVVKQ